MRTIVSKEIARDNASISNDAHNENFDQFDLNQTIPEVTDAKDTVTVVFNLMEATP